MKHRLTYLLVIGVAILSALAGSIWHPSVALANGEDYVFYKKDSNIVNDHIYARKGVFGNGLTDFNSGYVTDGTENTIITAITANKNYDAGTYLGTYKCGGYTISVLIGLNDQASFSNKAADIWVISATGTSPLQRGTTIYGGPIRNAVGSGCIPTAANTTDGLHSPHSISIPSYSGLGASAGENWYNFLRAHGQNVKNPGEAAIENTPGTPGGGSADDADTSPDCESGDFSFNWVLCPIFDGTNAVTNWIFTNLIKPLLMTNPICLDASGNTCDNTVYKIWSGFRIYGDIFLVIVLLVIVFGESIGGGLIDAYTAKKVLPRLLIAAILINLSIYIVSLAIDITNVVGGGIGQILTAPLSGNGAFDIQPSGITQGAIAAFGATGLLVGAFALGVTGIALLLVGLIITGAIAMVGIFVTLIVRQTIILGLLLISPIAFSLWCLPNTQQWFKRWWDLLFQMLLVYPMIILLFAVADVLSYVTQHNGSGGNLGAIVAFMLLIIPLYLVPFTLRSSGRLLGSIHGAVGNIGRQVNGITGRRAFAGAGKEASQNLQNMQTNRRFNPNSRYFGGVNKRLNSALSSLTSPSAAAKIYGGAALSKFGVENSMGAGILNEIDQQKFDHTQKLSEKLNQAGFNDRSLGALMSLSEKGDFSAAAIRQKANELSQSNNPNDRIAANQLMNNAAFLSQSLYKDPEMGRANIGMAAGLAVAAQGFSDSDEIAQVANDSMSNGSASPGLASSFVTQAQLAGQRGGNLTMKPGYGVQIGKNGQFMGIGTEGKSAQEAKRATAHQIKRILSTGQSEIQSAKPHSVKEMAPGFEQLFLTAQGPADADGNYEFSYENENGQAESLKFGKQDVERVAAMLGTAQADYSSAAAGTTAALQEIVSNSHLSGDVEAAYKRGRRDTADPARMGSPEPPSPEDK